MVNPLFLWPLAMADCESPPFRVEQIYLWRDSAPLGCTWQTVGVSTHPKKVTFTQKRWEQNVGTCGKKRGKILEHVGKCWSTTVFGIFLLWDKSIVVKQCNFGFLSLVKAPQWHDWQNLAQQGATFGINWCSTFWDLLVLLQWNAARAYLERKQLYTPVSSNMGWKIHYW